MKKILSILLTALVLLTIAVSCAQDVTVDAQLYKVDTEVFMLNGKYYATLQEAVNARLGKGAKTAGDNDGVIYLVKNAAGPGAVINDPNTPVVIDFAGWTYSFKDVTATQGSTTGTFGLSITGGAEVTLKGLEQIDLHDTTANLTMVYVEGASTTLTIEGAPKMKVEPAQYVFWAANGATLTIGGETTMTGGLAATGTAEKTPLVSVNDNAKATVSNMILESAKVVPNSTKELKVASLDSSESKIISTGSGAVTITESEGTVVVQNTGTGTVKVDENTIDKGEAKEIDNGQVTPASVSVAMIGTKEYESFEDAYSDSISGDTITLLDNIDLTSYARGAEYEFAVSGRTIDLNKKTISVRNKGVVFTGTNLVIKNGTFTAVPSNAVTGETINDSYALFIGRKNTATATLENLTLNGGLNVSHGSTVTIQGSETSINATKYYAVWAQGESVVTIKDGSYTFVTSGTVNTTDLPDPAFVLNVGKGETVPVDQTTCGTIIVENGSFTAPATIPGIGSSRSSTIANVGTGGTAGTNIALKGGVYSADPSAYVAEGYVARKTGTSEWTVFEAKEVEVTIDTEKKIMSLVDFANKVNNGVEGYSTATVKLLKDADLEDVAWIPIGTPSNPFNGSFDGQNLTVSGLRYYNSGNNYFGLFGVIGGAATTTTIANLILEDIDYTTTTGVKNVGGLFAGNLSAVAGTAGDEINEKISISNVSVSGSIEVQNAGGATIGGVGGKVYTKGQLTVTNCTSSVDITCNESITGDIKAAGIVGFVSDPNETNAAVILIDGCKNYGNMNLETSKGVYSSGIINKSWCTVYVKDCSTQGEFVLESTNREEGAQNSYRVFFSVIGRLQNYNTNKESTTEYQGVTYDVYGDSSSSSIMAHGNTISSVSGYKSFKATITDYNENWDDIFTREIDSSYEGLDLFRLYNNMYNTPDSEPASEPV